MEISMENLTGLKLDVFSKFARQGAVICAGTPEDYNCMTLGWGMMGNVWGHPGSAMTVYVSPDRYTWSYIEKNDVFTVSFFPAEYTDDVMYLGTHSGREGDKVAATKLTPIPMDGSVGFAEAELTFVCRKLYTHQFELDRVPDFMRDGLYTKIRPHYEIIGYITGVSGKTE